MSKLTLSLLLLTIIAIFFNPVTSTVQDIQPKSINPNNIQTELRHVGLLMLGNGKVEEIGYMRHPLKVFNEGSLQENQSPRYKKWDNFDLFGKNFYLSLAFANFGTSGLVRVTYHNYATGENHVIHRPTNGGDIPRLSYTTYRYTNGTSDDIAYMDDDLLVRVENIERPVNSRYVSRRIQITSNGLNADIHVNVSSDHESLTTITPLDHTHQHFLYDVVGGNLPVQGTVKFNNHEHTFDDESAAGGHTYDRGVLTDDTYILRARGQGFLWNGKRFSLALSSGYGDDSAVATGDGFILDRFVYKLNAVEAELNEQDLTKPIKFKTLFNHKKNFKECNVEFTPSKVEKIKAGDDKTHLETSQVFGAFSGYVTDYKNQKYAFQDLLGVVDVTRIRVRA